MLIISGCATGLGNKAHYVQHFEDTEADTVLDNGTVLRGAKTAYDLDIKGPPGMKWEEITSMGYDYKSNPDGTGEGKITVNSASKADTLATAELIAIVSQTAASTAQNILTQLMPFLSQQAAGKQAVEMRKLEVKENLGEQVIERIVVPSTPPAAVVVPKVEPTPEHVDGSVPPVAPPLAPEN